MDAAQGAFELFGKNGLTGAVEAKNNDTGENERNTMSMVA